MQLIGDPGELDSSADIAEVLGAFDFLDVFKIAGPVLAELKSRKKLVTKIKDSMSFGVSIYSEECIALAVELEADFLKIPSCRMGNIALHKKVREAFPGVILNVSTGMSLPADRAKLRASSTSLREFSCSYDPKTVVIEPGSPGFSCRVPDPFFGKAAALMGATLIEYKVALTQDEVRIDADGYRELKTWLDDSAELLASISKRPATLSKAEAEARLGKGWQETSL